MSPGSHNNLSWFPDSQIKMLLLEFHCSKPLYQQLATEKQNEHLHSMSDSPQLHRVLQGMYLRKATLEAKHLPPPLPLIFRPSLGSLSLLCSRLSHPSSLSHSHKIPWCSRPFTAPLSFYGHASQPQCLLCSEGQPHHLPIPLPLPRAHQCSTHPASITGNFSSSVL